MGKYGYMGAWVYVYGYMGMGMFKASWLLWSFGVKKERMKEYIK